MNKKIQEEIKHICNMIKYIFPRGKAEFYIFILFLAIYVSYSLFLALKTSLIDYPHGWDLYLEFDSQRYYNNGFSYRAGHPLVDIITKPLIIIGNLVSMYGTAKVKTVLSVIFTSSLVSLSVIYVFRYLREIICVEKFPLYLFTCFFGFFSTNMILCFTTDSFTLSLFILSFIVYFYSYHIQTKQSVGFLSMLILALIAGGITITNFVKGLIPLLFVKGKLMSNIIKGIVISLLWCSLLLFLEIKYKIFTLITGVASSYTNPDAYEGSYTDRIFSYFFGSPILLPSIKWNTNKVWPEFDIPGMIDINFYQHWWQYLFIIILLIMILISSIKNIKSSPVQMLILFFGFDILLHVIIGFGSGEAFLYGGHWVFLVPLFIGWLYKSITEKEKKILLYVISFLFLSLIINNIIQITDFINMAIAKFPSVAIMY